MTIHAVGAETKWHMVPDEIARACVIRSFRACGWEGEGRQERLREMGVEEGVGFKRGKAQSELNQPRVSTE